MRFAQLEGKRVAIWGCGREGRAAVAALRRRLAGLRPTLLCSAHEAEQVGGAGLQVDATLPDAATLGRFDVVIKSPGISAYKPEILEACAHGTVFTSGTALWFGENPDARVIAVTGTKGKSTTTAMLAHIARALGIRTALAGNIGLPLLELDGQQAELWAIELSSFQTGEAGPLDVGVITSLHEEHLDWHGSRERYVADKLKLADAARLLVVNRTPPLLLERTARHPRRRLFGEVGGWHVGESGDLRRGTTSVLSDAAFPLPGPHNRLNACAALAALDALLGLGQQRALAAAQALGRFVPLPHRLQPLGRHDGIDWIDDSISTTPQATLAALHSLPGRAITLIVGGHDRGLDWSGFAIQARQSAGLRIITQGANGPRIAAELRAAGGPALLAEVATLEEAVACARTQAAADGVILLSPGAPSFDQFRDYAERGRRFAELAGFDAAALGVIPGLGIC
ncbi:MAG TPA: UDP-N-acetylmuramoyl-L-alanine--D-glutamate ligase [Rhodanobacteraceae bacterium]|nr:UDP-N-acetylmuramoyl-L-alanine--D-glutamate ligase [Rhodanobacteraceae bacterium]